MSNPIRCSDASYCSVSMAATFRTEDVDVKISFQDLQGLQTCGSFYGADIRVADMRACVEDCNIGIVFRRGSKIGILGINQRLDKACNVVECSPYSPHQELKNDTIPSFVTSHAQYTFIQSCIRCCALGQLLQHYLLGESYRLPGVLNGCNPLGDIPTTTKRKLRLNQGLKIINCDNINTLAGWSSLFPSSFAETQTNNNKLALEIGMELAISAFRGAFFNQLHEIDTQCIPMAMNSELINPAVFIPDIAGTNADTEKLLGATVITKVLHAGKAVPSSGYVTMAYSVLASTGASTLLGDINKEFHSRFLDLCDSSESLKKFVTWKLRTPGSTTCAKLCSFILENNNNHGNAIARLLHDIGASNACEPVIMDRTPNIDFVAEITNCLELPQIDMVACSTCPTTSPTHNSCTTILDTLPLPEQETSDISYIENMAAIDVVYACPELYTCKEIQSPKNVYLHLLNHGITICGDASKVCSALRLVQSVLAGTIPALCKHPQVDHHYKRAVTLLVSGLRTEISRQKNDLCALSEQRSSLETALAQVTRERNKLATPTPNPAGPSPNPDALTRTQAALAKANRELAELKKKYHNKLDEFHMAEQASEASDAIIDTQEQTIASLKRRHV